MGTITTPSLHYRLTKYNHQFVELHLDAIGYAQKIYWISDLLKVVHVHLVRNYKPDFVIISHIIELLVGDSAATAKMVSSIESERGLLVLWRRWN